MNSNRRHSLPLHAWGAIFTISILCFISALGSGMLAWVSESDAQAINTAGSIRMATYRISFQLATDFAEEHPFDLNIGLNQKNLEGQNNVENEKKIREQDELNSVSLRESEEVRLLVEDMQNRLTKLNEYLSENANQSKIISDQFQGIETTWLQDLKPSLLAQDKQTFYNDSLQFVKDVDELVNELQYRNEQRQLWQQILQISFLILTIVIMLIGMHELRQNVLTPVQQLIKANYKFKQGKRNTRVSISGYTEFNKLGDSFNDMASTIETHQRSLESEVRIKTQHLVKANQVLSLFYDFSKSLTTSQVSLYRLDTLITDFGKILPHLEFTLCIQNKFINNKNAIILHGEKMKELCKKLNCDNCLTKEGAYTKSYPIAHQKIEFGELKVRPKSVLLINSILSPDDNDGSTKSSQRIQIAKEGRTFFESEIGSELDVENNELIVALTNLISTALSLRKQRQQEHQLILFEERSTIARELHDSLAQSLSYLKIQVSVLERHLKNGSDEQNEASVRQHIDQIKLGLSSAYQQLRDLLITFRLTIDNDNFDEALHEAANEFALKGKFDITVSNRVMTLNLSATEQIDLIQIAREALSNISRHAQAESVDIELGYDDEDKYIVMTIVDDGVGISGTVDQTQHHGLMIMKERAHNLGGELIVSNNQPQGTTITAKFAPNFFDESTIEEAYL